MKTHYFILLKCIGLSLNLSAMPMDPSLKTSCDILRRVNKQAENYLNKLDKQTGLLSTTKRRQSAIGSINHLLEQLEQARKGVARELENDAKIGTEVLDLLDFSSTPTPESVRPASPTTLVISSVSTRKKRNFDDLAASQTPPSPHGTPELSKSISSTELPPLSPMNLSAVSGQRCSQRRKNAAANHQQFCPPTLEN